MYAKQPKKLLIMNILDILRRYSDENHRLSQREMALIDSTPLDRMERRKHNCTRFLKKCPCLICK